MCFSLPGKEQRDLFVGNQLVWATEARKDGMEGHWGRKNFKRNQALAFSKATREAGPEAKMQFWGIIYRDDVIAKGKMGKERVKSVCERGKGLKQKGLWREIGESGYGRVKGSGGKRR